MHTLSKQKSQRLQRDPLSICRRPRCFLRHSTSHQLSSRSQNAATTTVCPTGSARLDVQLARHCLRHRHNGTLPLPARLARHWQQHEYVTSLTPAALSLIIKTIHLLTASTLAPIFPIPLFPPSTTPSIPPKFSTRQPSPTAITNNFHPQTTASSPSSSSSS